MLYRLFVAALIAASASIATAAPVVRDAGDALEARMPALEAKVHELELVNEVNELAEELGVKEEGWKRKIQDAKAQMETQRSFQGLFALLEMLEYKKNNTKSQKKIDKLMKKIGQVNDLIAKFEAIINARGKCSCYPFCKGEYAKICADMIMNGRTCAGHAAEYPKICADWASRVTAVP